MGGSRFSGVFALTALIVGFALTAEAMTFDELKAAIAGAADGATVEVTSDVDLAGSLSVTKRLTLTSAPGDTRFVLRRTTSDDAFKTSSGTDLVLTNIVVDGNSSGGVIGGRVMELAAGTVTLADGTWLKDFAATSYLPSEIMVRASGHLIMEAGAKISGFVNPDYGTAVLVGNNDNGAIFDMRGGLITECSSTHGSADSFYGGVVYVYGGTFNFSGGLITGNVSEKCVAGITAYSGTLNISGDATVTNNVGGAGNDLLVNGYVTLDPDFKGWLTAKYINKSVGDGQLTGISVKGGGRMFGAARIRSEANPTLAGDGYTGAAGSIVWRTPVPLWVDGDPVATWTEAYAAVGEEGVIELSGDIVRNAQNCVPAAVRKVTFTSRPGQLCRFDRNLGSQSEWGACLFWLTNETTTVRFENIVLDGAGGGASYNGIAQVDAGTLELGPGAVLQNGYSRTYGGAVYLTGAKAVLKMEDGAVIRNCRAKVAGAYGAAVCVGDGKGAARFEMSGGVISNCVCDATSSVAEGYGGVVYTWGGTFEMTGGKIVDNVSSNGASGVYFWSGAVRFGGDAVVSNNLGTCGDLYCTAQCKASFFGDFRGWVGASRGVKQVGATFGVKPEAGATGAWCFHPAGTGATDDLVGMTDESNPTGELKWGAVAGRIGATAFASAEDAARGMPKAIAADASGRAGLPLAVSGVAKGIDASVSVDFDPAELKASGVDAVPLFAATDGPITGNWTFTLPDGVGDWHVARRSGGYVLCERKGLVLIVR